jgi:hypothetical protein
MCRFVVVCDDDDREVPPGRIGDFVLVGTFSQRMLTVIWPCEATFDGPLCGGEVPPKRGVSAQISRGRESTCVATIFQVRSRQLVNRVRVPDFTTS